MKIKCYARLHFGLFNMNLNLARINGGFGLYTNYKISEIEICHCDRLTITADETNTKMCTEIIERLSLPPDQCNFHIRIDLMAEPHVGLGTHTQLSLGIIKAIVDYLRLELSDSECQIASMRGGTSGIGIHTFFTGGFVVDGGGKKSAESCLIPSSFVAAPTIPPVLSRADFPERWGICLVIPDSHNKFYGQKEKKLFQELTPIDILETNELISQVFMAILPAVIEQDFHSFCHGIDKSMTLGFKKREIACRESTIRYYMESMKNAGFSGVGMSSFGPTLFGFSKTVQRAQESAGELVHLSDVRIVVTHANNYGVR